MRPGLRFTLAFTLALLLAGCAATLETQVTSFHRLSNGLEGQRFVVTPTAGQKGSLEFDSYADLVRQALIGKGLLDAGTGPADLNVTLRYAVEGVGAVSSGGTSGYAGFGIGSGGLSVGSFGIGIGIPIGAGGARPAEPVSYQHSLRVEIDRLGRPAGTSGQDGAGGSRVFEVSAISEGPSASLAPVMPAMIRAVFQEFPGPNGRTRVVSIPLEESR